MTCAAADGGAAHGGAEGCRPGIEEFRRLAREHDLVPVARELLADCDTPVGILLRIDGGRPCFLLESVEGGERLGRYSFLGTEPETTLTFGPGTVVRDGPGREELPCADPLATLWSEVCGRRVASVPGVAVPFSGGAVGFLGYEAATCFERVPVAPGDALGTPLGWFGVYRTVVVFDHVAQRMTLVTHADTSAGDADGAYLAAVARLDALAGRLRAPLPPVARSAPAPSGAVSASAEPPANVSREEFMRGVERCREYILAGDIFQVQLSRRFARPVSAGAVDVYRALRAINPSPYMFYLATPFCAVAGSSPEMLVRVTGRHVDYHPIAGTRRRGATPERDLELEAELRASEKERAEHLMLVDLGRNDVGRVCRAGTVRVTGFMEVARYSHVMHLESSITGELEGGRTAVDALRSCFPAGTVTGAPKLRAMEIIAELEPERRGVYAGAVGYLGFGGNLDTAISLRTVVVRQGTAYAQAAAGVVADSTPAEEALEIDNKVAALLSALDHAERSTA